MWFWVVALAGERPLSRNISFMYSGLVIAVDFLFMRIQAVKGYFPDA
jgi:hypothetical protein